MCPLSVAGGGGADANAEVSGLGGALYGGPLRQERRNEPAILTQLKPQWHEDAFVQA